MAIKLESGIEIESTVAGYLHGEVKAFWWKDGKLTTILKEHYFLDVGVKIGHHRTYNIKGELELHKYFFRNSKYVDLIKNPKTEKELMVLVLLNG